MKRKNVHHRDIQTGEQIYFYCILLLLEKNQVFRIEKAFTRLCSKNTRDSNYSSVVMLLLESEHLSTTTNEYSYISLRAPE